MNCIGIAVFGGSNLARRGHNVLVLRLPNTILDLQFPLPKCWRTYIPFEVEKTGSLYLERVEISSVLFEEQKRRRKYIISAHIALPC